MHTYDLKLHYISDQGVTKTLTILCALLNFYKIEVTNNYRHPGFDGFKLAMQDASDGNKEYSENELNDVELRSGYIE